MAGFLLHTAAHSTNCSNSLGLLREDAFRAGPRALLFVGLAWGVLLILTFVAGNAFGPAAEKPYLLELGMWVRFFIATDIFVLLERRSEEQLRTHLARFSRAPLLAPGAFETAAGAVTRALKRRDAYLAEIICLAVAVLGAIVAYFRLLDGDTSSWASAYVTGGKGINAIRMVARGRQQYTFFSLTALALPAFRVVKDAARFCSARASFSRDTS